MPFPDRCLLVPFCNEQHFDQSVYDLLQIKYISLFNTFMMNGPSHSYHLDESTFILRGIIFFMKLLKVNISEWPKMERRILQHLGLYCLPMSHKKDARHK